MRTTDGVLTFLVHFSVALIGTSSELEGISKRLENSLSIFSGPEKIALMSPYNSVPETEVSQRLNAPSKIFSRNLAVFATSLMNSNSPAKTSNREAENELLSTSGYIFENPTRSSSSSSEHEGSTVAADINVTSSSEENKIQEFLVYRHIDIVTEKFTLEDVIEYEFPPRSPLEHTGGNSKKISDEIANQIGANDNSIRATYSTKLEEFEEANVKSTYTQKENDEKNKNFTATGNSKLVPKRTEFEGKSKKTVQAKFHDLGLLYKNGRPERLLVQKLYSWNGKNGTFYRKYVWNPVDHWIINLGVTKKRPRVNKKPNLDDLDYKKIVIKLTKPDKFWKGESKPQLDPGERMKRCYGVFGCLTIGPPFVAPGRLKTVFPKSFPKLKIAMAIKTSRNKKYQMLKIPNLPGSVGKSVHETTFDPKQHTYFVFHGYLGNKLLYGWPTQMANAFVNRKDCNVIVGTYNANFPYFQAYANIRLVGRVIAHAMLVWDLNPYNTTYVGHSLGASLGGFVSNRLEEIRGKKLWRISVLDATRLGVDFDEPPEVRLDMSDAKFVENIRTDVSQPRHAGLGFHYMSGIGASGPIGHVDFLPNGGKNPKCESFTILETMVYYKTIDLLNAFSRFGVCDHFRAVDYFIESIKRPKSDCPFFGVKCKSWADYEYGRCTTCKNHGDCCMLGFNAEETYYPDEDLDYPIVYYMKTGLHPGDLCRFQYKISIQTKGWRKKRAHYSDKGNFYVILVGKKGKYISDSVKLYGHKPIGLIHGTLYQGIITGRAAGPPKKVLLIWKGKKKGESSGVRIKNIKLFNIDEQKGMRYCPTEDGVIKNKFVMVLKKCHQRNSAASVTVVHPVMLNFHNVSCDEQRQTAFRISKIHNNSPTISWKSAHLHQPQGIH